MNKINPLENIPNNVRAVMERIYANQFSGTKTVDFGKFSVDVAVDETGLYSLSNLQSRYGGSPKDYNGAGVNLTESRIDAVSAKSMINEHLQRPPKTEENVLAKELESTEVTDAIAGLAKMHINEFARRKRDMDKTASEALGMAI